MACSCVENTLNQTTIVIGEVSDSGEYLLDKVDSYCRSYVFPQTREITKLVLAALENDEEVIGRAQLIMMERNMQMVLLLQIFLKMN